MTETPITPELLDKWSKDESFIPNESQRNDLDLFYNLHLCSYVEQNETAQNRDRRMLQRIGRAYADLITRRPTI
jgi:hypothetical protein